MGWFPEMYLPNYRVSESCAVGVVLSLAVKLTEAGVGDYWDDVDRWVRNYFAEAQLTNVDWVYRTADLQPKQPVAWYESTDHAAERNIGAFGGAQPGNDWGSGTGHCCTGNCTRAIYPGISFLASRRLRGYTCLPPVWPSAHNIFPQMVPLAPFRPSGVLKTNALPASGSVFSDTAACRGSLRINFSAAKAELPRGHWQPSNPPHHRRKQPPCQMALRQQ